MVSPFREVTDVNYPCHPLVGQIFSLTLFGSGDILTLRMFTVNSVMMVIAQMPCVNSSKAFTLSSKNITDTPKGVCRSERGYGVLTC